MLKAENEVNATLEELKLGTVWALFSEKWYRVRITSISDGYVEVQSLDYGFRMEKVCYLQLHTSMRQVMKLGLKILRNLLVKKKQRQA